MSEGIYLYCIMDSAEEFEINLSGIDNIHQPYVIFCQDVGILVSKVSLSDYGPGNLEKKVRDLKWLQEKADRHETIIEQVMERTTVVPITFGTIFKEEEKLKKAVQQSLTEIKEIFEMVAGHEEWGLKLYCDFSQLRETISGLSPEIEEIERRLKNSNEENSYFLKRRLDVELDKKIEEEAYGVADKVYDQLSNLATKSYSNELLDLEIDDISKSMILNSVYLVDKENLCNFLLKLKDLKEKYFDFGFHFYFSGPWPPYNFSKLDLKENLIDS